MDFRFIPKNESQNTQQYLNDSLKSNLHKTKMNIMQLPYNKKYEVFGKYTPFQERINAEPFNWKNRNNQSIKTIYVCVTTSLNKSMASIKPLLITRGTKLKKFWWHSTAYLWKIDSKNGQIKAS